ncbi:LytTR family DNA-binding domain-containing protein [Algoriphagus sp. oki45]|uniref:LytR/AlgR family response regulator transcription factor n=1 Tax=Algoriphagus sp. oki45 TaxID=3067294 RepID=UPI0027EFBAEC|nr:LytTR family DNA-binding domain-containing protein [Algoriphagus sp. oki45]
MIKTLIIDDEPLAAELVKEYLMDYPLIEVVAMCQDGFSGFKAIQEHHPDLIFLDIQMPKITGFEMLELLDEAPAVVFTTAFDQYALKAFDAQALDYLLKPFSKERFKQAMERVLNQLRYPSSDEDSGLQSLAEKSNRLVVRVKNDIKIIPIQSVRFFEAEDDYVAIHTEEGKFLKKMTMKQLEDSLDQGKFARVHRSYLINLNEITGIEPYERESYLAKMRSGEKIPVSKSGYARLRQVLGL